MATEIKNTPVETIRARGGIKATIWKNASGKGSFYSIELSRTYKTDDGYNDSRSFSDTDLLVLTNLLPKAYDRVAEFRRSDAANRDASGQDDVSQQSS